MFLFLCKRLIQHRTKDAFRSHVRFLQTSSSSLESFSSISNSKNQQSLTVSYLMNSCGVSLESAISASKKIHIESTEKPDLVLELLRTHGFTKTHIANLISKLPSLLFSNPDKTLKPKIEYFESLGISSLDLPKFLCSDKYILLSSLRNRIIPNFDFLRSHVHTNENIVAALKQSTRLVRCSVQKVIEPNISILQSHGVPESNISRLIVLQPRSLMTNTDLFKEVVRKVEEMGFDPTSTSRSFVLAIRTIAMLSKLKWENKREALKSFGWSEDDILSAFKVQPMYMLASEKKIKELMDFFVNKVGLKPTDITRCPNLFLLSLEKRIIPRCSVLQILMSKGLIEKDLDVVWVLNAPKNSFEKKFVINYQEIAPEVLKAYQGEMEFLGLYNGLEDVSKMKQFQKS
ncbi:hypothetical protein HHK36_004410 [Tetracentron sinense]|uniref:Uncharacterized protein n=1 Tax=Tetracentron sinense TaxID=13715 RepID=A0A834ZR42_TETSI|nr:hypothetical protein HHK36_004410 [Tetracentron sinense]